MTAMIGWVLVVLACWPAFSPRVETGVLTTCGLLSIALGALGMALGFGVPGSRSACIWTGVALVAAGEAWRWYLRGPRWSWYRLALRLHRQER